MDSFLYQNKKENEQVTVRTLKGNNEYDLKIFNNSSYEDKEIIEFISISLNEAKIKWRSISKCSLEEEKIKNITPLVNKAFMEASISMEIEHIFSIIEIIDNLEKYLSTGNKKDIENAYEALDCNL